MARRYVEDDDGGDELDDRHGDSDDFETDWDVSEDASDEDGEPTIPCPHCRRDIYEDVAQCPYCRNYVSAEDAPPAPKPWWLVLGVAACLYAIYRSIVG